MSDNTTEQVVVAFGNLESLARAASPGLWEVNDDGDEITLDKGTALTRWNEDGTVGYPARSWNTIDRLAQFDVDNFVEDDDDEIDAIVADLEYIAAARPDVVLTLIAALRAAEEPKTPRVGLYRNNLGAELHVTGTWLPSNRGLSMMTLGDIAEAEARDPLFGTKVYLVTDRSLRACGYQYVSTEGASE